MTATQNTVAWGGQHRVAGYAAVAIAGFMAGIVGLAITARPIIESTVTSTPAQVTVRDETTSYLPSIPQKAPVAVPITGADQLNAYMESLLRKAADAAAARSLSDETTSYLPSIPQKALVAVAITGADQFNAYMDSLLRKAADASVAQDLLHP